jgi:hypothetical protein
MKEKKLDFTYGWIRIHESTHREVSIDNETLIAGGILRLPGIYLNIRHPQARFSIPAEVRPVDANIPSVPDSPGH